MNNILIIDDSPINLEFLSMYFEKFNAETTKVYSTEEARKEISAKSFDMTFLDYHMPIEDGVAFLKAMKANNQLEKLGRIIVVTADTNFDAKKFGINGYIAGMLSKPLDINDLDKLLE